MGLHDLKDKFNKAWQMDYYRSLNAASLDPDTPTIFELLSARQLEGLINPYLRYLVVHYAQRHPQYLLKVANRFDELFLVLFGTLEYYHLKNWNASFTERFYGLKHVNVLNIRALNAHKQSPPEMEKHRRLTKKQVYLALAMRVLWPYIDEKLCAQYDKLKGMYAFKEMSDDRPPKEAPIEAKLKFWRDFCILNYYPYLTFSKSALDIWFITNYLFQASSASCLSDKLFHYRYSRLSKSDYDAQMLASGQSRPWSLKSILVHALNAFNYALPSAMFLLKFAEWWHSSEIAHKLSKATPLLDPPKPAKVYGLDHCPLCKSKDIQTPTVLETGVVFCYKCIFNYLSGSDEQNTPQCPVTSKALLLTTWNSETSSWQPGGLRRLLI